ncbi:MAG: phage tail protein, partial [Myxococcota bacterium]|nr:phage tail protein [Myxococcota bacterium]
MYPKNDISWDLDKYLGSFNFKISINSIAQEKMKVVSVNNIVSESDIVEYMLGPEPYVRKIPGKAKFSEIEITRIYQGYDSFYDWRTNIEDGLDDLRDVTVEILAPDLETTVRKMVLHNCWPHKWQLPNLDASSTAPAIETIILACERITQGLNSALTVQTSSAGADTSTGTGAIGGREGQIEADYGDEGDGPKIRGNASGEAHWTEWQDAL